MGVVKIFYQGPAKYLFPDVYWIKSTAVSTFRSALFNDFEWLFPFQIKCLIMSNKWKC